ncbi:MAG TPA: sensor histidine kinase [Flexivirga sp.]|uniref:sensor histidine kinase n=1 Tax=Flexivirga sp. TaxID=1962927 RepID=UPI002CF8767E|nr:sensor histidine kinase [Flexivirga sp.]HWC23284.1 sensor histidine kinase [Flexivirga sp.]
MERARAVSAAAGVGWMLFGAVGIVAAVQWKARLHEAERRADAAERSREEEALRRTAEERLRIARELHDSLTHSISVIKVQAGVATHLARKQGEEPSAALLAIQEASGDAARELRATLDVLRREDVESPDGLAVEHLPALVQRTRDAGLRATLRVSGSVRRLPADVDEVAYRVVQEALTNAVRHAGDASVTVEVVYDESTVTIRVDDDGTAAPKPSAVPGYGLVGMRERVTGLGGTLRAEPGTGRGFSVLAELPVGTAS